ncbi:AAA family ATPase, partial [Salmonella enterica]|nr:AAA family ATPase [Salmonella enterica subsp. enterica serovar Enteritidis]
MRIDKLSLLHFRCFRQLDITFDEHITILVAPNGAGKTTVLDAVRLALFPFIRGLPA